MIETSNSKDIIYASLEQCFHLCHYCCNEATCTQDFIHCKLSPNHDYKSFMIIVYVFLIFLLLYPLFIKLLNFIIVQPPFGWKYSICENIYLFLFTKKLKPTNDTNLWSYTNINNKSHIYSSYTNIYTFIIYILIYIFHNYIYFI